MLLDVQGGSESDTRILNIENGVVIQHEGISQDPKRRRLLARLRHHFEIALEIRARHVTRCRDCVHFAINRKMEVRKVFVGLEIASACEKTCGCIRIAAPSRLNHVLELLEIVLWHENIRCARVDYCLVGVQVEDVLAKLGTR